MRRISNTPRGVVSQFRNYGYRLAGGPPGGRGGWGLGKPDRTVWQTARLSVAGTPVTTYDDGFPKAPPAPPALSAAARGADPGEAPVRYVDVTQALASPVCLDELAFEGDALAESVSV